MNPEKLSFRWGRCFGLVVGVCTLLLADLWRGELWFQTMVLSYYFAACDDLPLDESRFRKAIRSISAILRPALSAR